MPALRPSTIDVSCCAEVVAGLVNDGSAQAVADAAVELSRRFGAPLRFVYVVPTGTPVSATSEVKALSFATALRSLRHGDKQRVTFESPAGDPSQTLVQRSAKARALVVGEDHTDPSEPHRTIAAYCVQHARCEVHVVAHPWTPVQQ